MSNADENRARASLLFETLEGYEDGIEKNILDYIVDLIETALSAYMKESMPARTPGMSRYTGAFTRGLAETFRIAVEAEDWEKAITAFETLQAQIQYLEISLKLAEIAVEQARAKEG